MTGPRPTVPDRPLGAPEATPPSSARTMLYLALIVLVLAAVATGVVVAVSWHTPPMHPLPLATQSSA